MKRYLIYILCIACLAMVPGSCSKDIHVAKVTDIRLVSVAPGNVYPGDLVTILGRNFSAVSAENSVLIGGMEAMIIEAYRDKLLVICPELETGQYSISITSPAGTVEGLTLNYMKVPEHEYLVTTEAGQSSAAGTSIDGIGTGATCDLPTGLGKAPDGSIWFTDRGTGTRGNRIRRIARDLTVTTIADASAANSAIWQGCFGPDGNWYFTDKALGLLRKCTQDGTLTTLASGMGSPMNVAADNDGNLYVSARDNKAIYKFDRNMDRTTFAEIPDKPNYVKFDPKGNLVVTTNAGYRILSIAPDGTVSTIAGDGVKGTAYSDGLDGDPLTATLGECRGLDFDSTGAMYFTDISYHLIRKITPDADGDYSKGILETVAGSGKGYAEGKGLNTKFNEPDDVLVYDDSTLYIADAQNHSIRKIIIRQ